MGNKLFNPTEVMDSCIECAKKALQNNGLPVTEQNLTKLLYLSLGGLFLGPPMINTIKQQLRLPMPNSKKIVRYTPDNSLIKLERIRTGYPAFLFPVDHPGPHVTNTTLVRTSPVLRVDVDTGEIETENTIYVPEKN